MNKAVAIITARGGSKRIPRKNIKDFVGKPIIAYSILAALDSCLFDEVMVSTDDNEIAEISQKYGASIPFLRSAETSNDIAHTAQVLVEVLNEYKKRGLQYLSGCCIYPTAPFVTPQKLKDCYRLLIDKKADCVMPVAEFSFPILRSMKMDADSKIAFNWPENATVRSQDLPPAYHDCGQYYFFNTERFLQSGRLITGNTYGLATSAVEVQDIDNEDDWKLAELKYAFLQNQNPYHSAIKANKE